MGTHFLSLSTWWGLSDKPGRCTMYLHHDGSFVLKLHFYLPVDQDSDKEFRGTIDSDRLNKALAYAKEHFLENYHHMIYDAGFNIEYIVDGKTIRRENDTEAWRFYMELLPEFKDRS